MAKKFVKVLEWAKDKKDAQKKSESLTNTVLDNTQARELYTIEPKFVSGKWAAVLYQK